jgi:hypothetical protein
MSALRITGAPRDGVVEVGSCNREPTVSVHMRIVVDPGLFAPVAQVLLRA